MQGFDQMWQNGIGFTATSIWQVPFRFCRGFSTATILDRGDLKILGFCSVTLSLKKTGQKVTSLLVMVHKLARHSLEAGLAASAHLQTNAPKCLMFAQTWELAGNLQASAFVPEIRKHVLLLHLIQSLLGFAHLCWHPAGQNRREIHRGMNLCQVQRFILSGFYLFQSFQKATGSLQVGRLSKHSSHLGKPLVNVSAGLTHAAHSDQHFIEQLSGNEPASATVTFFNSAVALSPCNRIVLCMSTPLCSSTLALIGLHRWHMDQCQV